VYCIVIYLDSQVLLSLADTFPAETWHIYSASLVAFIQVQCLCFFSDAWNIAMCRLFDEKSYILHSREIYEMIFAKIIDLKFGQKIGI